MRVLSSLLVLTAVLLAGTLAGAAEEKRADPEAVALLREVYRKREAWGPEFPGFTAALTVVVDGGEHRGSVRVGRDRKVAVELADPAARDWATGALQSIVSHRSARSFEEADGRYPLTFGPDDRHASGRLVRLNDGMDSTYRIRDGQILQVNRSAGPNTRFTIDILENVRTDAGRYLPRAFTVSYYDAGSGELVRTDTFRDEYRKIGGFYLPEARHQVTAERGGSRIMLLELEEVRLL